MAVATPTSAMHPPSAAEIVAPRLKSIPMAGCIEKSVLHPISFKAFHSELALTRRRQEERLAIPVWVVRNELENVLEDSGNDPCRAVGRRRHDSAAGSVLLVHGDGAVTV